MIAGQAAAPQLNMSGARRDTDPPPHPAESVATANPQLRPGGPASHMRCSHLLRSHGGHTNNAIMPIAVPAPARRQGGVSTTVARPATRHLRGATRRPPARCRDGRPGVPRSHECREGAAGGYRTYRETRKFSKARLGYRRRSDLQRAERALDARVHFMAERGAAAASHAPGCCKHGSSSHPAGGRAVGIGQRESRRQRWLPYTPRHECRSDRGRVVSHLAKLGHRSVVDRAAVWRDRRAGLL